MRIIRLHRDLRVGFYWRNTNRGSFIIYNIDVLNDIEFKDKGGTLLYIKTEKILDGEYTNSQDKLPSKYYFRMRIDVERDKLSMMFRTQKNISPFQDAFVTTQVIDFRLNNLRSCNQFVRDEFAKGRHFTIKAVHYLLLRKATDVFIHQGEKVSSRLLERELWDKYIEGLKEDIIAYHFKKVAVAPEPVALVAIGPKSVALGKPGKHDISGIDDFCILTRFEFSCTKWMRLLQYICVIVYIGMLSGYFLDWIKGQVLQPESNIVVILGLLCIGLIKKLSHK